MSTEQSEEIFLIGERFREERVRIGLSQTNLAAKLFTSDRTIKKYEGNETSPRAVDLARFGEVGGDVLYIVTGKRQSLGVAEPAAEYAVSTGLASFIARLKLSIDDAKLIEAMARRIAQ